MRDSEDPSIKCVLDHIIHMISYIGQLAQCVGAELAVQYTAETPLVLIEASSFSLHSNIPPTHSTALLQL
jgi:hypothetical protein